MAEITSDDVRHIARLARLHLEGSQVDAMRTQLARILEAFSAIQACPLAPGEDPAEGKTGSGGRTDSVEGSLPRDQALAAAPDAADGHIRIPRVLD